MSRQLYLTNDDQQKIYELIVEYLQETQNSTITTRRGDIIMTKLFTNFFDKLILGVIYNSTYNFWKFAELDDLIQEGRVAIITSIQKNQFKIERGTIFNFFSTVVARNLINYTKRINKKIYDNNIKCEFSEIQNESNLYYIQLYEDEFIIDEAFAFLKEYFKNKKKFEQLIDLLYKYYILNKGKKFIKKHFIIYAKAYNYSPAHVNNFFAYLKRLKNKKQIQVLLEVTNNDY